MAVINACMLVGHVVGCSMEGIALEELSIETDGDGTAAQCRKVHETVCATPWNRFDMANAIRLNTALVVA